ncbi:hypothetical protein B0H17DRAFT_164044 [Mycena rosella]|uniref:Uncharacterized protein n=1 Tax=Mycena rosella TaxID=1033263 RepID=A0AAD7GMK3_MYCRO|nr:hypothetical protein B0H17DRAFT_164044 [Mycena rosella]
MSLAPPPMPSLSLSDIMHPMSPPPRERAPNSPVAETLHDQEIAQMRAKALQMGLGTEQNTDATPRERELFDMVLRLTNPNTPSLDPAQLVIQAETISGLVHQRDYLTRLIEEERSMWESEKAGWERMAEALIVQRNRKVNGPEDSELRRMYNSLEFDNKALKEKLDHTQGRITALEAELLKLKPHLLMQPFVPRPTQRPTTTTAQQHKITTSEQSTTASQQPTTTQQPPTTASAPAPNPVHTPPPTEMETENMSENVPPPLPDPQINSTPQSSPEDAITVDTPPTITIERPVLQPPTLHALAQASAYFESLPFPSLQNVATTRSRNKKLAANLKKALQPGAAASASASQSQHSNSPFAAPPGARTVLNVSGQPPPPPPPPQRKSRHGKARRAVPPQLLVSDARAEHLLIAARRIGRERAGIVAGVISAERERMEREKAEREREQEKERAERERRNRGGGAYYRDRLPRDPAPRDATRDSTKPEGTGSGGGSRYATVMAGYVTAAGTPAKSDAPAPRGKRKSVPTPLDSLLNAARSMMDGDESNENENGNGNGNGGAGAGPPSASTSSASTGMMTRRRTANANEPPQMEGPAPKRRRLSSNTSESPARVRTALDVLADQAAVFSHSGKGKGKAQSQSQADELADSVPTVKRKRGRPPNKDRNKVAPAPALSAPSKASRVISPVPVAGPSRQGPTNAEPEGASASASTSISASETGLNPRPATKWVQRGRLASSASSRAPPRQKDDLESEDEDGEEDAEDGPAAETDKPTTETDKLPEPAPAGVTLDPVVKPTAPVTPRSVEEPMPSIDPAVQDDVATEGGAESLPASTQLANAVPRSPPTQLENLVPRSPPPAPIQLADPVPRSPPLAPTQFEDPVLDADADGESDPDVDMDGN